MNGISQEDAATPEQKSAALIAYLDRRGWALSPEVEEKAFRSILRNVPFIVVVMLADHAKVHGKALSAADLYRMWLTESDSHAPGAYAIWFNLGVELGNAGAIDDALTAYRNALVLKPDLHGAAVNLGLLYERKGETDQALLIWGGAVQPDEARIQLLNHRGRLLESSGRLPEAEAELYRSLLLDPRQPDALSHWLHLRMKMCAWPVMGPPLPPLSRAEVELGASGLSVLALFDDNVRCNQWVERWLERRLPVAPERLSPPGGYRHDKIRVGYLSSDYNLHPVSMLTAELFERHDRDRFEVYGYDSSFDDGSPLRHRVLAAFDHVTRIAEMSDEAAARAIRADEIDILVDLNGLTAANRLGVVRWRPAPVQITYLGFVGSMPVPELDYALVDSVVVPPELAGDFFPKPLYLPRCYQVNDSQKPIGAPETRAAAGLPPDRFVYCCFSNTYKITEEIFECWMRILAAVDGSVLWVLARSPRARETMLERAAAHGIAADRLIFAQPTSPPQYLARLALADLFLDTFPYNSGTTASDVLLMGLPIVTLAGKTFASRMAASLMRFVGAEEGITTSFDAYVERAIAFGRDPERHRAFRDRLAGGEAWRRTLGDTTTFIAELEECFRQVRLSPA